MSRTTAASIGITLTAAVTGALLINAAANASTRTRVEHFHARTTAQLAASKTSFVLAEKDVAGSAVIGHDVLFCHATKTHSTCHVAFAQRGGLLYAEFRLRDADHSLRGTVAGGTGNYAHAHGTISGQMQSASNVRVALRYQV